MKYSLILIFFLLSTIIGCTVNKTAVENSKDLRQEAKDFSLSIVELYFEEDCKKFYDALSDTIIVMDGDGIFPKVGKEEKLCKSVKAAIKDPEKTFQDYKDLYIVELLTPKELVKKFDKPLPEYYQPTDTDFFFLGVQLKEGKASSDDFIWDDMFFLMVRKENQTWTIKGVSG